MPNRSPNDPSKPSARRSVRAAGQQRKATAIAGWNATEQAWTRMHSGASLAAESATRRALKAARELRRPEADAPPDA